MNQENAPHMQPMEQAGTQGAAPATAPETAAEQPAQPSMPVYGYAPAQFAPAPMPGSNAATPYQGMPYGAYPQQMSYGAVQGAYQNMMQPGYAPAAFAQAEQTAPVAANGEMPQIAQQPAPMAYQQAPYPMQQISQAAQMPAMGQFTPQMPQVNERTPQMAAPNQAPAQQPQSEAPFVPSFVEAAAYDESFAHTMNGGTLEAGTEQPAAPAFDYHYISSPARIAIYDSLKTAPRVIQVQGGPTHEYIEHIASLTYKNAKELGGMIPYTVIREVSENFIHAKFNEVVVSIFDKGNTIRFADQGPGIKHKDLVQEPGFSSAIEPMKRYIRGVGSGLPIVKDYLSTSHGHIEIKDNVNQGSVVTISLVASRTSDEEIEALQLPELTENEIAVLKALMPNNTLGISEVNKATGVAVSSVSNAFSKMEEKGLLKTVGKKRTLTQLGAQAALSL